MTRDQHDHVKRKDINKAKKRFSRLNTNRRIALYRLLGQNQEEILDLVRISNLAGAEGFEPSARGFGAMPDVFQYVSARSNWCRNVSAYQAINGCV